MTRPVSCRASIREMRLVSRAALLALILLAMQLALLPAVSSAETDDITVQRVGIKIEYPVSPGPQDVAWESPGRSWFTSPSQDMVGVITRDLSSDDELIAVSIEYLPQPNGSMPYGIAYADDTVWFTLLGTNQIGRIDLSSAAATVNPAVYFSMPVEDSGPSAVAVGADGHVWIVNAYRPRLTRFDPATEAFTEYSYFGLMPSGRSVSTPRTLPDVATSDGSIVYFTVPGADRVLAYKVGEQEFSVLIDRAVMQEPAGITVDASTSVECSGACPWVTLYGNNWVGRYAPNTTGGWAWFSIPTPNSGLHGIAFRNNGATWDFWFAEEKAGKVGRLTFTPAPSYQLLSLDELVQDADSKPRGIATGGDATVWFAENGRSAVSELRPPYARITRAPLVMYDR